MSSTLIEKLVALEQDEKLAATKRYRALVDSTASGNAPGKIESVLEILRDAAKTPADFQADIDRLEQRRSMHAKIAEAAATVPLRERAASGVREAAAVLEAAERAFQTTTAPLYEQIQQADTAQQVAEQAATYLVANPEWPEQAEQLQAAEWSLVTARNEQARIQRLLNQGESQTLSLAKEIISDLHLAFSRTNVETAWSEESLPTIEQMAELIKTARGVAGGKVGAAELAGRKLRMYHESKARLIELEPIIAGLEKHVANLKEELLKP